MSWPFLLVFFAFFFFFVSFALHLWNCTIQCTDTHTPASLWWLALLPVRNPFFECCLLYVVPWIPCLLRFSPLVSFALSDISLAIPSFPITLSFSRCVPYKKHLANLDFNFWLTTENTGVLTVGFNPFIIIVITNRTSCFMSSY